jgi:hypothetical protein
VKQIFLSSGSTQNPESDRRVLALLAAPERPAPGTPVVAAEQAK